MPDKRLERTRESYTHKCRYCDATFKEAKELQIHNLLRHTVVNDEPQLEHD